MPYVVPIRLPLLLLGSNFTRAPAPSMLPLASDRPAEYTPWLCGDATVVATIAPASALAALNPIPAFLHLPHPCLFPLNTIRLRGFVPVLLVQLRVVPEPVRYHMANRRCGGTGATGRTLRCAEFVLPAIIIRSRAGVRVGPRRPPPRFSAPPRPVLRRRAGVAQKQSRRVILNRHSAGTPMNQHTMPSRHSLKIGEARVLCPLHFLVVSSVLLLVCLLLLSVLLDLVADHLVGGRTSESGRSRRGEKGTTHGKGT